MKIRSLLFVPARDKMLKKICDFTADGYIIDLEDSIGVKEKDNALISVLDFLETLEPIGVKLFVRLNKDNYLKEAEALEKFTQIGFMLPKFESCEEYMDGIEIWKKHETIGLIETPKGIINLPLFAGEGWPNGFAFGAEDYTATVNMENIFQNLIFQKSMLVTYGKAYGKAVYDTPSFQLENYEQFIAEVDNSVGLGFDGKLSIHPKHVEYINNKFAGGDLEKMRNIVKEYETCGNAILVLEGVPYEKMHIQRFKKILKENGGI